MKRAWFDKHKTGCVNFSCEFHPAHAGLKMPKKVMLLIRLEYY